MASGARRLLLLALIIGLLLLASVTAAAATARARARRRHRSRSRSKSADDANDDTGDGGGGSGSGDEDKVEDGDKSDGGNDDDDDDEEDDGKASRAAPAFPSPKPSRTPSESPSASPSRKPSRSPSASPSASPSRPPSESGDGGDADGDGNEGVDDVITVEAPIPEQIHHHHHHHNGTRCLPGCGLEAFSGHLAYDNKENVLLSPVTSCNFHTFPYPELFGCLQDTWVLFFGGSYSQVMARRTVSFLNTKGSEMAYPFTHFYLTFDHIFDRNGTMRSFDRELPRTGLNSSYNSSTVNEETIRYLEENAWAAGSRIATRISMINDMYLDALPAVIQALPRLRRSAPSIKRVAVMVGPIALWFKMCVTRSPFCHEPGLMHEPEQKIDAEFNRRLELALNTMATAKANGDYDVAVLLGIMEKYDSITKTQLDQLYLRTGDRSTVIWMPGHTIPLADIFVQHPSAALAMWFVTIVMMPVCMRSPAVDWRACPQRAMFTHRCTAAYLREHLPPNTQWIHVFHVTGCAVSFGNY